MIVDDEIRSLCPPLHADEYEQLRANLLRDGCRAPLVVWEEHDILLDGHNRRSLCEDLGIPYEVTSVCLPDRDAAMEWVIRNQFGRRNLTPYQRAELVLKLEPLVRERAKDNQRVRKGNQPGTTLQNSAELSAINTRQELASEAHVSQDTIARAKYLHEHAGEDAKQRLRAGETTIHAEYTRLKREEQEQQRQARRDENAQRIACTSVNDLLAAGVRYATIVCDPPWDWGDEADGDQFGRARPTYGTMPLAELLELPVGQLTDEDCHLYLWITNRSLPKGFALLERWGFRYVTALTWCKPTYGLGNYFRGATEHVLFGVRGSQPLRRHDAGTWFAAPRGPLGHSSKPPEFYDLVESCSPPPYLEMFARQQRPGWSCWGAETDAG